MAVAVAAVGEHSASGFGVVAVVAMVAVAAAAMANHRQLTGQIPSHGAVGMGAALMQPRVAAEELVAAVVAEVLKGVVAAAKVAARRRQRQTQEE